MSIPTAIYHTIAFDPPLPPAKLNLSENTVLGYYAKTILVFEKPWWRTIGLSGILTSPIGPIMFTRDTCIEEDNQYSITCFIVGDPGRKWSALSIAGRKQAVLMHFTKLMSAAVGEGDIPHPINIIEMEWVKQPWSRGAPSPVMGPGILTSGAGRSLKASVGNMHFIGTETLLVWKGYMEGAVRSGIRGAEEVIDSLSKQAM